MISLHTQTMGMHLYMVSIREDNKLQVARNSATRLIERLRKYEKTTLASKTNQN
jgi:hypothetical protein